MFLIHWSVAYFVCRIGEAVHVSVYCSQSELIILLFSKLSSLIILFIYLCRWFGLLICCLTLFSVISAIIRFSYRGVGYTRFMGLLSIWYWLLLLLYINNWVWIRLTRVLFSFDCNTLVRPELFQVVDFLLWVAVWAMKTFHIFWSSRVIV